MAKRVSYIPFLTLAAEWAAESGMTPEFALRNLCEWTIAGAFPPDSLKTPTGASVAPLDVYLSSLALIQSGEPSPNSSITLGRFTLVNGEQRWGLRFLSEILVNVTDILVFCERTNTLPPPSISHGPKRTWVRWTRTPHLAPSPFPDSENIAIRFHEHEVAVGTMNRMRSCLKKLQGTQSSSRNMRQPGEPIDLTYYQAQWDTGREFVKASIESSGETALLQPLRELDDEWAAFTLRRNSYEFLSLLLRSPSGLTLVTWRSLARRSEPAGVVDRQDLAPSKRPTLPLLRRCMPPSLAIPLFQSVLPLRWSLAEQRAEEHRRARCGD